MDRFLYYPLSLMPYLVITLIVSFTVHELAHAYVAYKFGDDTAKKQGRLTLNPIKHLDPFGTILILVAGFLVFSPYRHRTCMRHKRDDEVWH